MTAHRSTMHVQPIRRHAYAMNPEKMTADHTLQVKHGRRQLRCDVGEVRQNWGDVQEIAIESFRFWRQFSPVESLTSKTVPIVVSDGSVTVKLHSDDVTPPATLPPCPNDTNGDGDCHLCAYKGGCKNEQPPLPTREPSIGYDMP